ncbi:hypothetical protein V8C86DRAFT_2654862 [Haematococcus lacustris]
MAASNSASTELLSARDEIAVLRQRIDGLSSELRHAKEQAVAVQLQAEREEEAKTNLLMRRLEQLKREKLVLATEVEQEEEFLTNTLQKRLEKVASEKAELEVKVVELKRQTEHLAAEKAKLCKEKVDLEATLELESEFIVNSLQVQLGKLGLEKKSLLREKTDLQRQVTELGQSVEKLKRDHVKLEQEMEMEEEQIANKMARQMQALVRNLRLIEEKLAVKGITMKDLGIQPHELAPTEAVRIGYSRSPSSATSLERSSQPHSSFSGQLGSSPTMAHTLLSLPSRREMRHHSSSGGISLTPEGSGSGLTARQSSGSPGMAGAATT